MFLGNGNARAVRSRYPRCANAARSSADNKQIIFKFSHAIFPYVMAIWLRRNAFANGIFYLSYRTST
jgi:hypothetical protein